MDFRQSPPHRANFGGFHIIMSALFLVLVTAVAWLLIGRFIRRERPLQQPDYQSRQLTPRGDLTQDEEANIRLFHNSSRSVVFITTTTVGRDSLTLNLFEIPRGTGSGIVYDRQGHILTNYHVIENAGAARVTLADQSTWDAKLVGAAPDQDIAVLRIDADSDQLFPIPIGSSGDLEVGQKVLAIGNPFGLDMTLTTGVISGLGREIKGNTGRRISGVIQTDAAINPGNSGGPLLDSSGRLIGVNTAIYSPSGAYAGIGFAVPVDAVNRTASELIRYGKLKRPGLGIATDDRVPRRLGMDGVLIVNVLPGSAAEKAGLQGTMIDRQGRIQLGDIITGIADEETNDTARLLDVLDQFEIGDTVKVTIRRNGEEKKISVTLQER